MALKTNGRDEPLLLLVSSDGAGSAAHSQEGSRLVCEEVLKWLEVRLSDGGEFLQEADGVALIRVLQNLLIDYAEVREYTLRDLACTLNVAAILPDRAWFAQVGDGATVVQRANGAFEVVCWPDNGEYANQTYFVTDVPDHHVHTLVVEESLERVSLMTDGLHNLALLLRDRAPHQPFFLPLFRALEAFADDDTASYLSFQLGLERFLDSPTVNARTSDDKTLILASRRASSAEQVEA